MTTPRGTVGVRLELLAGPHHAETWPGVGHVPHHEDPARTHRAVADRLHRFAVPEESTP